MNNTKKMLCYSLMLILCFSFICCSGSNTKPTQTTTVANSAKATTPQATDIKSPKPTPVETPIPTMKETASPSPSPKAILETINPYVIKADVEAFLSPTEVSYFKKALDAIFARKSKIRLTDDYDSNLRIGIALHNSPYYFLVKEDNYTSDHKTMKFTYTYSSKKQEEMRKYIDNEYLTILNKIITPGMNDLEKVLAVYRYFASRISYNYEWLDGLNMSDDKFLYPEIEIYEALKTNRGVCHSYSYLCEFALQQLNIKCLRVTGEMKDKPEDGHMWLLVQIDGNWYHCDPTWDSTDANTVGLQYFGMTDEDRAASGVNFTYTSIDTAFGNVSCTSTLFKDFRDVTNFSFGENHTLILESRNAEEPLIYNTLTHELVK